MNVFVINNCSAKVREQFYRFVPKEFLKYTEDGSSILIGATIFDAEGIEACGITILSVIEGELVIRWMWMDPDVRLNGGGTKMLEACYGIAATNDVRRLTAFVPDFDDEIYEEEIYQFLYENDFIDSGEGEIDGQKVNVLVGDAELYLSMENYMANQDVADRRRAKAYDKFPNKFVATEIEYFSGVSVEEAM